MNTPENASPAHIPIMVHEMLDGLITDCDGFYIDATFGEGGHTRALLARLNQQARVLALDRDTAAIARGTATFAAEPRLVLQAARFSNLGSLASKFKLPVAGVLLDLGLSSRQLATAERGFSFSLNGPLDMRMDAQAGQPLASWLAKASQPELTQVLRDFGEEPAAAKIAAAIVATRKRAPLKHTKQLADLIASCLPPRPVHKTHVATRSFQAFRIYLNQELTELRQGLAAAARLLVRGGRLVVISFHSLEAREIKQLKVLKDLMKPLYKTQPTRAEILANPRSRSAVLRVMEKLI